jgi:predicted ferric reductase
MVLDFGGNAVSVIEVVALILLVIGVYPYRIRTKNKNLIMHGFLSILALALNLFTVFLVMIPAFSSSLAILGELSIQSLVVWLHVVSGVAAIVLGFVIIISWVTHPLGELGCSRTWKLMLPTFAVWAFALAMGLIIFIYNTV